MGGVGLTGEQLAAIKAHRYTTNALTPLEVVFYTPIWDFLANRCLPDWLAPNALTLMGLIVPILSTITIGIYSMGFDQALPAWVILLGVFALLWFQHIDSIDGK